MDQPTLINKEMLQSYQFAASDVLSSIEERAKRRTKIEKAVALGNLYKNKVKIFFRNAQNAHMTVETTIWAMGEKFVVLKGGVNIPIHAIEDVITY